MPLRNPIYLAREYKKMINDNQAKNQTELARLFCISRTSDSAKKLVIYIVYLLRKLIS